ncbi:DNA-binding protein WhiA [Salininema proteolyticum]|uniref:Probable cell division protein WhiA n=1 Tax=Salininema proteolyticum TaxID=1607685 RepID=A0ABV8U0A0_9ACTN
MAMTSEVKDELSRVDTTKSCCQRAELGTLFRFSGGLHLVEGAHVMVEAEVDSGSVARRANKFITELYNYDSQLQVLVAAGLRRTNHYLLRVLADGGAFARQIGLSDARGYPIRGLPAHIVGAYPCCAEAAWRAAFMARGSLTEPGRSSSLEITCPGPETAIALVGAARRLGVAAKARDVRGVDRVVIRDGDAISDLLTRIGAHSSVLRWEERRVRREVRATANRLANFDDANLRRSARAAVAAAAKVTRALEILGEGAPDHLADAGRLRVEHRQASLEELGALADPPLTKDAIAGRIRRLISLAAKKAAEDGEPGPDEVLSEDGVLVA